MHPCCGTNSGYSVGFGQPPRVHVSRGVHDTSRGSGEVYLHFDNTGYFMGEKMWFTAYVVRADGHRPGVRSRVLYVELLNPGGDVCSGVS